jgi:hypothetical protein
MDGLYQVIKGALSSEVCGFLRDAYIISKQKMYGEFDIPQENNFAFGDSQSPISWVEYANPISEALMINLIGLISTVTGKRLAPTYSYSRIYWEGSTLLPHTDRPSCEYSITLCIANDPEPWPIFMGGNEVSLEPGDLVVYKGCEIKHWRDTYKGKQQIQVFLHYVDLDGPYAEHAFDKRQFLGQGKRQLPKESPSLITN